MNVRALSAAVALASASVALALPASATAASPVAAASAGDPAGITVQAIVDRVTMHLLTS